MATFERCTHALRSLGPYLLIELLLPGGTLIAMLLWLYERMARSHSAGAHQSPITASAIEQTIGRREPHPVWCQQQPLPAA